MPATFPSRTSSTCSDHGAWPPAGSGLYWANAGDPFAVVGMSYEPTHANPGPRHQATMSSWVWSHRS
jgi:hypothetical protein